MSEEAEALLREIFERRKPRLGWERSKLSGEQVSYILSRERIIEASEFVRKLRWQEVDCENQTEAQRLIILATIAIDDLRHMMARNEEKII